MVAQSKVPHSENTSVDFPSLPQTLRNETVGVDSPEPENLSLDTDGADEPQPEFREPLLDEVVEHTDEPAHHTDLLSRYKVSSEALLQTIPLKQLTLLRIDLKLAAGQSISSDVEEPDYAELQFARFSQHTVEHIGGELLGINNGSLLWGFSDEDPVVGAQRASAAALELLSSIELFNFQQGCDFHLHISLASGQAQMDESVAPAQPVGQLVELSHKISALAPSDSVYLCQQTVDFIDSAHQVQLIGQIQDAESDVTISVHQLVQESSGTLNDAPKVPALIGRESELEALYLALNSSIEEERGRWLMLSGVSGIGKTRLLEQFHSDAAERNAESYYLTIGNDAHAPRPCFLGTLALQVSASRYPGLALEQVHQRLSEELLLSAEDQALFARMLGLGSNQDLQGDRVDLQCDLLARLLSHRRASPGLLVIVEDMHWATDSAKQRLALLCDRLLNSATLLVFSSRDCFEQQEFSFGSDMLGSYLNLVGLTLDAAFDLSATFLPVQTPVVHQCVARASGNPLFLTQQLQAAIDTIESQGSGSLRGIVTSKLQRLESEELEQLQCAAVLGSRLTLGAWSGILGSIPAACDKLVQRQLLCMDSTGYRFTHDLVHSVVYRAIDKPLQKELHLRAARYFENNAETAAWHYLKADEALSGVGQVILAGTAALSRGELNRAATLLDALVTVDETQLVQTQRFQLHRLRADCHTRRAAYSQALESHEHAILVAEPGIEQAETKLNMAACYGELNNTSTAMQLLGEVLAESRLSELPTLETRALVQRAEFLTQLGRCVEAESDLRAALTKAQSSGNVQSKIDISQALGELLCRQAKVREAEQLLAEAHQQRDRLRHGAGWAERDPWLGQCLYFLGDVCGARDILQAAVEHAKSVGDQSLQLLARCFLGPVLLDLGEPASALANGKLAMAIGTDKEIDSLASMAMVAVGESHIRLGKYALGLQMLTQAWSRAESTEAKYSTGPWALAALATVVQRDVEQRNLLAKGEHLLHSGAEGLSHFWFYRLAIQVAIGGGDEHLARRYAKLLKSYDESQELPWVEQACSGLIEDQSAQMLVSPLT